MNDPIRYGVFSLGNVWKLCSDDGLVRGFPTRAAAVANARSLVREAIADGIDVELLIQDERGLLTRDNLAAIGH
jgi:hypothetical protein